MDQNLSFYKSIAPTINKKVKDANWDAVLQTFKQKKYKQTILDILDYVHPDLAKKTGNAEKTEFIIPHGSCTIEIKITNEELYVNAPFVDISKAKKIPLMRKVAELNFSPLNLSSIVLKDNKLAFEYKCPLDLCEPYKTYDAFREICMYSDSYDDEFISKFDAQWVKPPQITDYTQNVKEKAKTTLVKYVEEANAAMEYFESKRSFNSAWDILVITLMKIEYYLQPQGLLRIEIEKMVSYLIGDRDTVNEKNSRGKTFLNKLIDFEKNEIEKSLYSITTFIPYKIRSNTEAIISKLESSFNQAKKARQLNNHMSVALTIQYNFLYILYYNEVPPRIQRNIEEGLEAASGEEWEIASNKLYKAFEKIIKNDIKKIAGKRKGFFNKLFGK